MHRHDAFFIQISLLALLLVTISSAPAAAQAPADYLHWYLAEGAQNAVFDEEILISNPTAENAQVTVTLLPEPGAGTETSVPIAVGAHSRYTLRLAQFFPGNINGAVSARIDSNVPIVVERSMYWANGQRGAGHNALGLTGLSTRWELAEGASGFWETFILLVNPNQVPATVTLTFLPAAGGAPQSMTRVLQPASRNTVWVNGQEDVPPAFRNAQFSTTITSDQPIAVERAMYWNGFSGGTDSTGTREPAQTWYFGEGATSGNASLQFETFLLLENPNAQATTVHVSFFKDGGGIVQRDFPVQAQTRRTVSARLDVPEIGATGFSMTAQSTNPSLPIVAERAMYWLVNGNPVPADGHTVQGVGALSTAWAFAEGIQGSLAGVPAGPYDTFFLISNPHPSPLELHVHVVRADGTGAVHPLTVAPQSRYTLYMGATDDNGRPLYPAASNQRFATTIRAVGSPLPFLAERAVYWGGLDGGHASAGVPWGPLPVGSPTPIPPPQVSSVAPGTGRLSGGTQVTIRGRGFQQGASVTVGGAAAGSVRVIDDATIVAVTPPAGNKRTGPVSVTVTNPDGQSETASSAFTYNFHVLAFGDSITAGTTSFRECSLGSGCRIQSMRAMTPYPQRLQQRLVNHPRFAPGGVVVRNEGRGGECASSANCGSSSGETRFAGVLDEDPDYDLVVLLEGINDLARPDPATVIERAHGALRRMVREAKARAKVVVICKLTPVEDDEITGEPRRSPASIAQLNRRIEDLTLAEGLFRINWNGIEMSADGLHPSQDGYNAMAQQVYDKVIEILSQ